MPCKRILTDERALVNTSHAEPCKRKEKSFFCRIYQFVDIQNISLLDHHPQFFLWQPCCFLISSVSSSFRVLYPFPCITLKLSLPFYTLSTSYPHWLTPHATSVPIFWPSLACTLPSACYPLFIVAKILFQAVLQSSLLIATWTSILSSIFEPNLRTNANRLFQNCP